MQTGGISALQDRPKKCSQCNTINPPSAIYCQKCHAYLQIQQNNKQVSIWQIRADKPKSVSSVRTDTAVCYVSVCPECGTVCLAENKKLPNCCHECGYFFQFGIDKIIKQDTLSQQNMKSISADNVKPDKVNNNAPVRKNPMPHKKRIDNSSLRLIPIKDGIMPVTVSSEKGAILGFQGTVLKYLKTDCQVDIWHNKNAGWYLRVNRGIFAYNENIKNVNFEIKLSDGDRLNFENEKIRIEIAEI